MNVSQKSKYAGNLMINTRTLVNIHEHLSQGPISRLDQQDANRLIVDFLTLLEAVIVGKQLFYDGTVGGDRLEKLENAENYLESNMNHPNASDLLTPAEPTNKDHLHQMCHTAAERANVTIIEGLSRNAQADYQGFELDQYETSIRRFADDIARAHSAVEDRKKIAACIIQENAYPGSKCVGGIILCSTNQTDRGSSSLDVCAQKLRESNSREDQSKVLDYMMNAAFRPNLLPAVANDICDAALLAHEDLIQSCCHQNFLSVDHLVRKSVHHKHKRPEIESLVRLISRDQTSFPWFGLFCFLQSNGDTPFGVLDDALAQRHELAKFVNVNFSINPTYLREDRSCDEAVFAFVRDQYDNLFAYAQEFDLDSPCIWDTAFGLPTYSIAVIGSTLGAFFGRAELASDMIGNVELVDQVADLVEALEPVLEAMSHAPMDDQSISDILGEDERQLVKRFRLSAETDEAKCLIILSSLVTSQISAIRSSEGSLGNLFRNRIDTVFSDTRFRS